MSEYGSQDLTQTQTQITQDGDWFQSQTIEDQQKPWARITPRKIIIKRLGAQTATLQESLSASFELYKETFTIGRDPTADWSITYHDVPPKVWDRISKFHCRISKDDSEPSNPVFIHDLSRNGTFLNGELIGMNLKRILKTDDVISFNDASNRVFQFVNCYHESYGLPDDVFDRYHVGKMLGSGAQGMVRLVINRRTCEYLAMKQVQKTEFSGSANKLGYLSDAQIMREVSIMRKLSHPNIIRCEEVIIKPQSVFMILEFMEGGDLLHRIQRDKKLSVPTSKFFFIQLCHAVKYLHDQNITHRDIKPDNILLQNHSEMTMLKLSDFGLSKLLQDDSQLQTMCGTPLYVSPEILSTAGRGTYTCKVDIWSLGVVLYAMLSGCLPFSNEGDIMAPTLIKRGQFNFNKPAFRFVPDIAKNIIKMMLTVNPRERASIDDILMHPWLQDDNENLNEMNILYPDTMNEPPPKRRRVE